MESQDVSLDYEENIQENSNHSDGEDQSDQDSFESIEPKSPEEFSNDLTDNLENKIEESNKVSNIEIEEEIEEEKVDIDSEQERKKKYFRYALPTATLLNDPIEVGTKHSETELHQKADGLIYALETFGVKGKVRRINQGPVITLFEI